MVVCGVYMPRGQVRGVILLTANGVSEFRPSVIAIIIVVINKVSNNSRHVASGYNAEVLTYHYVCDRKQFNGRLSGELKERGTRKQVTWRRH